MIAARDTRLSRAWAVLDRPAHEEMASFPLDVAVGGIDCRVALDRDGKRHLLVPCDEAAQPDRPSVLSAVVRRLIFGTVDTVFIDLCCHDHDLNPEFDEVIEDVLESVAASDRPAHAALDCIARWRRLFRSRLVRGLSINAKMGLFAELAMLSALVDVDPRFAVEAWRGPLREPHDFEAPTRCIEVKSVAVDTDTITVNGIQQLDRHGGRPLDLVLTTVTVDADGTTISELVDQLLHRVTKPSELRGRLNAAGWQFDPTVPDIDAFGVQEVWCVSVGDTTPRLVPGSLRLGRLADGITGLTYRLDTALLMEGADNASLASIAKAAKE